MHVDINIICTPPYRRRRVPCATRQQSRHPPRIGGLPPPRAVHGHRVSRGPVIVRRLCLHGHRSDSGQGDVLAAVAAGFRPAASVPRQHC